MAEHLVRVGPLRRRVRVRVDLHGVSVFGPGKARKLVRWEWIQEIAVGAEVRVRSATDEIALPRGSFDLQPHELAQLLEQARSITRRPEVIARLMA